jgi:hypothetical protein
MRNRIKELKGEPTIELNTKRNGIDSTAIDLSKNFNYTEKITGT